MSTAAGPTSSPSHVASDGYTTRSRRGDTCFKCKSQGHWARNCPLNSPYSKSPPSSSSSSPLQPSKLGGTPIVQCLCGSGPCDIRTSRTPKNPNRRFFVCPVSCGYFNGWCDEVSAPVCPCLAGTCSINTDPVSRKKFFACRIKKGHGACGFFQWVDDYNASAKVRSVEAGNAGSPVNVPPRGVMTQPNEVNEDPTFADFLEASQSDGSTDLISKFEELIGRVSPEKNQSNFGEKTVDNRTSIPSSGSEDLEMEDREPPAGLDKRLTVSRLSSLFANVHLRQTEFLKELSATSGNTLTGGIFSSLDDISASDYINLDGTGRNLLPDVAVKSAFNTGLPLQSTAMNGEDHTLQNFLGRRNENCNPVAEQIFDHIKWGLVKKLESSDQHDPAQLQRDASIYFAFLDHLPVDSQQFKECVNKFIQHALSLAEMRTGASSLNVLLERYEQEKRKFEEFSRIEAETLAASVGCSGRIESLRLEASRLKGLLLTVEKELGNSEEEFAGINKNLSDIHHKMELTKASMEDASADAAEASSVLKNMELEQCAMKAALEEAKQQLNQ